MFFYPSLVAAHALVEAFACLIGTLINIYGNAVSLQTHALPKMDGTVGTKLAVFFLDAHMARRGATDITLDSLSDAILHVTAQGLAEVEILSGNLYRHCPRVSLLGPYQPRAPWQMLPSEAGPSAHLPGQKSFEFHRGAGS
jgi:hypothetical protein